MIVTTRSAIRRVPALVAMVCGFLFVNSLDAAPVLEQSECEGKFVRSTVTVSTKVQVGTEDVPSYRITWRLPAQPALSTVVRPPPADYQIGFSFKAWQGYVDQKNQTARLSTPSGMEEVKLDCRRRPYARPEKRR